MRRMPPLLAALLSFGLVHLPATALASTSTPDLVRSAIADVQDFWKTELPRVYGMTYEPIPADRLHPFSKSDPPPACGGTGTTPYEEVAGNAFYCDTGDFVAWDAERLIPKLQHQFGDLAVALVFAHEFGHVIQARTGTSATSTIPLELQADCFAGAWVRHATATTKDPLNLAPGELEEALSGFLYFRDPTGTSPRQTGAHGSAFDRIAAFNDGFSGGVERCKTYDTRPPLITEIPFTSGSDAAREGNLPFGELLITVRKDLDAFWRSLVGATPVRRFVADAAKKKRCASGDTRPVVSCPDRNVPYGISALRRAYRKLGDAAVGTLMAEAWARAAVLQGRVRASDAPSRRPDECLAGAWARHLVDRGSRTGPTLSPGDLDEAVAALLSYPGRSTRGNEGFTRFRAFRKGFVEGARACGLSRTT